MADDYLLPIGTDRLIVRRMAATDRADLLAFRAHPDVLRWVPQEPMTDESAATFLAGQAAGDVGEKGGYLAAAIEHRADDRMIGEVGMYLSPAAERTGDVGWLLHPDYQRHGYAAEAARAMLAHGFAGRGLHRITSACDAANHASVRLMERLGMRREAHTVQSRFANGAWQDAYAYALLRDEWLAARGGRGSSDRPQ